MKRAERRHEKERIKERTRFRGATQLHMTAEQMSPKWIGKTAATHWTCMCWQCRAPGKYRKPAFERIEPTEAYL